jgi:hypothetical protein
MAHTMIRITVIISASVLIVAVCITGVRGDVPAFVENVQYINYSYFIIVKVQQPSELRQTSGLNEANKSLAVPTCMH